MPKKKVDLVSVEEMERTYASFFYATENKRLFLSPEAFNKMPLRTKEEWFIVLQNAIRGAFTKK